VAKSASELLTQILDEELNKLTGDSRLRPRWSHLKNRQNMYRYFKTDSGCYSCWSPHRADDGFFYTWTLRPVGTSGKFLSTENVRNHKLRCHAKNVARQMVTKLAQ